MIKKSILMVTAVAGLSMTALAASSDLKTQPQKSGYAVGAKMGQQFKLGGVKVDSQSLMQGFSDAYNGRTLKMSDDEMKSAFEELRKEAAQNQQHKMKTSAGANLGKANIYLAKNKKQKGVVTLPSGLQYKVLTSGNPKAKTPTINDTVTVDYEGKLINGKVFDSSYKRHQPATFPVKGVIPGWTQALQKMTVGSTWMLYIPPNLGYGKAGMPMGGIGPNELLIFKVHLLSIK